MDDGPVVTFYSCVFGVPPDKPSPRLRKRVVGRAEARRCDVCCICHVQPRAGTTVVRTRCGHVFHGRCGDEMRRAGFRRCPLCRLALED